MATLKDFLKKIYSGTLASLINVLHSYLVVKDFPLQHALIRKKKTVYEKSVGRIPSLMTMRLFRPTRLLGSPEYSIEVQKIY